MTPSALLINICISVTSQGLEEFSAPVYIKSIGACEALEHCHRTVIKQQEENAGLMTINKYSVTVSQEGSLEKASEGQLLTS